jgi:tyrosine-protein kinase Etk/Wzc
MNDKQAAREVPQGELNVFDLLIVLAKHRRLVVGLPIVAVVLSIAIALMLPNVYTARTKILPPQQTQATSAVLAQLGSLAGLAGPSAAAALKNPNDLYVGMLKSRTVADNLIRRFDLNRLYDKSYPSDTRRELAERTAIVAGKDGIITIDVDDRDPKRAAEMANAYVDELFKLTKVLAVTEASQRRLFFERQLDQAKGNLAKAEVATRQALNKGGLVQVEGQGRVMAETSARLRAELTVKEIQIGAMRTFASDQNPELLRTQQQVEVIKRELSRIEGTSSDRSSVFIGEQGKGIDNLRLLRELKYHEATFELLAKQYELAKIDEAKDSAIIQVMDEAVPPDRKSKPRRSLIVVVSGFASVLLALLGALLAHRYEQAWRDADKLEKLERLKDLLRRKPRAS